MPISSNDIDPTWQDGVLITDTFDVWRKKTNGYIANYSPIITNANIADNTIQSIKLAAPAPTWDQTTGTVTTNGTVGGFIVKGGFTSGLASSINVSATASANPALSISSSTQHLRFNPNSTVGAWNPLVAVGDYSIIGGSSAGDTKNIIIGKWSSNSHGIVISPGRVGINKIAATNAFEVNGSISASASITATDITTTSFITVGSQIKVNAVSSATVPGFAFGTPDNGDSGIFCPADGVVAFSTDSTERMRIGSNTISTSSGVEIVSNGAKSAGGNIRMIGGSWGAMFRNDGTNLHLLSTATGDQSGTWNANRPFMYNFSSGLVTVNGLNVLLNEKVGIGTSSPNGKLHIHETTGTAATSTTGTLVLTHGNDGGASSIVFPSKTNATSDYAYIQYQDDATVGGAGEKSKLIIGVENDAGASNRDDIILKTTGGVGINNNTPTVALDVTGDIKATGDIIAYATSDRKFKDNIKNITNALDKVSQINGVTFDWNDKQTTFTGHDIGVIAQEVEVVLPEIVATREDGSKAVKYEKMVALLIECVKELKDEIDGLKLLIK